MSEFFPCTLVHLPLVGFFISSLRTLLDDPLKAELTSLCTPKALTSQNAFRPGRVMEHRATNHCMFKKYMLSSCSVTYIQLSELYARYLAH